MRSFESCRGGLLVVDSTLLLVLHLRQVSQSTGFEGADWVTWGSFSVYGLKLHLLCATNGVPVSYELSPANVAEVHLAEENLAGAGLPLESKPIVCRLLGDLAYRSEALREALAEHGISLVTYSVPKTFVLGTLVASIRRISIFAPLLLIRCRGQVHKRDES
jgi:hypothetical protein